MSVASPGRDPEALLPRRLERLAGLNASEIDALTRAFGPAKTISADRELVREGEEPSHVHVLIDGWAAHQKLLPDGRRQVPALLLPGDVCDIDGLYVRRYDYGVVALTACHVASIGRDTLLGLIDDHPRIGQALTWLAFVENAILSEWIACLGRRSAREHLAHLLCELHARLDAVGRVDGGGYLLPLTQEELSDALGLTSVHVNRTLQGLRSDGLIALESHRLTILDMPALQRAGGFSPDYLHLGGMRPFARAA